MTNAYYVHTDSSPYAPSAGLSRNVHAEFEKITTGFDLVAIAIAAASGGISDGDYGDITVSGVGTVWTIDPATVTLAKMANIATDKLIGRDTAGTGVPEAIGVTGGVVFDGAGNIQTTAFTGDVTKTLGGTALTIANDAVTYAKMQNVTTARLHGRATAGSGDVEEITLGTNLSFTGTTLNAASTPGGSTTQVQFNDAGVFGGDAYFRWDKASSTLLMGQEAGVSGQVWGESAVSSNTAGAGLDLRSGSSTGTEDGATTNLLGGDADTAAAGGPVLIYGGTGGSSSGDGGYIQIVGGSSRSTSAGGVVDIVPGSSSGGGIDGVVNIGLGAALATTATGGFVTIPTCAGVPTGVPAGVVTGNVAVVYDTTNNRLYIYNGAWKRVAFV
jgi:hypothetical protein